MALNILFIDPAYSSWNEGVRIAGPLITGKILEAEHKVSLSVFIDAEKRTAPITERDFHALEEKFIRNSVEKAASVDAIVATSWTDSASRLSCILKQIKQRYPSLPMVVGGYHIRTLAEQVRPSLPLEEYPWIDVASISQQGTFHINEILSSVENKKGFELIPGIAYRTNRGIQTNLISSSSSQRTSMMHDFGNVRGYSLYHQEGMHPDWIILSSSQGCPWGCYFCVDSQDTFARKDVSTLKKELKTVKLDFAT